MTESNAILASAPPFAQRLCLIALLWLAAPFVAFGQAVPQGALRSTPISASTLRGDDFSLEIGLRPYNLAAQNDHREPVKLDPQKTTAIIAYMKSVVILPMVNRTILDVSYHLGAAISQKNPDKGNVIGYFVPQEIVPVYYRNYQAFLAIYGVALTDILSVEEIKTLKESKNQPLPDPLQKKFLEVMRRFTAGAEAQAGGLYAMLIATQKTRLEKYQLRLELSAESKH